MDGGMPLENLTSETEDILNYLDFGFYDEPGFMKMLDQASGDQVVGLVSHIVLVGLFLIGS